MDILAGIKFGGLLKGEKSKLEDINLAVTGPTRLHNILVKKNLSKLEKEYRDCIKSKWRQDSDMNETL